MHQKKSSKLILPPNLKGLKIVIVHDILVRYGGAEKMLEAWAKMFPSATIYTMFLRPKKLKGFLQNVSLTRIKTSKLQKFLPLVLGRYQYLMPWFQHAVDQIDLSQADIVISSSTAMVHGVITAPNTLHISYIHSTNRYLWDYFHKYRAQLPWFLRHYFIYIAHKQRLSDYHRGQRPDVLIAAATEPQRRIAKYWRRQSDIIFPFVDTDFWRPGTASPPPKTTGYFLIYGQFTAYKRFDLAISVANKLGLRLLIIGHGALEHKLRKLCGPTIEFLGPKYGEELREYVRYCRAFLFVGAEDFGMTAIEVMACGRPVIALRANGAKDSMVAGLTGEFFNEETTAGLERGIARFLVNENKYQAQKIRAHALQFNLERFHKEFYAKVSVEWEMLGMGKK